MIADLREIKSRKTTFCFKADYIGFSDVTRLAEIRAALLKFPVKEYAVLLNSKMGGTIEFSVHTNNEDVANIMRGFL